PNVSTHFTTSDKLPLPKTSDCSKFINQPQYDDTPNNPVPYIGAFVSNYTLTSKAIPVISLYIFITDPSYNLSNQTSGLAMQMEAFDAGKVIRQPISSSFLGYLGYLWCTESGNQPYIESDIQIVPLSDTIYQTHPVENLNGAFYAVVQFVPMPTIVIRNEVEQRSKSIFSLLGVIGGIWSSMAAFYIFLFGYGIIYPWGFVQRSKPFREKYNEKFSPLTVDLQSDDPDIKLDNLEKRLKFYENIVDTSILTSNKTDASPTSN
ncbi:29012_t:CDS:2, partial [Racocetra persica]